MMWPHSARRLLGPRARWRVSGDGSQVGLQAGEDGVHQPWPGHQVTPDLLDQAAEQVASPR